MPEQLQNRKRVTILGAGYVGKFLRESLADVYQTVLTSRAGTSTGLGTQASPLEFDLARPETWPNVLTTDFIVWTFPAATVENPESQYLEFYKLLQSRQIPTLVLASTSCYLSLTPDECVDESFPLDCSQPRVHAEEILRQEGCFILALCGIYGPGRDPVSWLKRGLVKNADQFLNLIHISDIHKIIESWLKKPLTGIRLNASDGRHRRWGEILEQLKKHSLVEQDFRPFENFGPVKNSKRVVNKALLETLYAGPFHSYPENGL